MYAATEEEVRSYVLRHCRRVSSEALSCVECWRWYKCLLHTTDYRLSLYVLHKVKSHTEGRGRGGGLSLTLHYSAERRVSSHPHSAASDSGDKENIQTFSNHSFALEYSHLNPSFVAQIYTIMYFY